MRSSVAPIVYRIAEPQSGYLTSAQARAEGIQRDTITKMVTRGDLERVSHGVYRIARYPVTPNAQYLEAMLWPQRGVVGTISHQSALAFHGLSDVSPSKLHITIPPTHRVRRRVPRHLAVHHAILGHADIDVLDGVRVTKATRSILDAHADHLGWALIRQAIADGVRTGKVRREDAAALVEDLEHADRTRIETR